jgi:holliday junction DNA helicase RuvA
MIAFLRGNLTEKSPVSAIIECGGVGYEVNISLNTYDKLPSVGTEVALKIHYTFNEMDGVRLFGFFTEEEKSMYKQLISISKIGPKTAIGILSGLSVNDLISAVQTGDVKLLSTVPGIGKKSAERLIIELKDKVGNISADSVLQGEADGSTKLISEAESALMTLGYKQFEIRKILKKLVEESPFSTSEQLVKSAIRALYKKRNV